MVRCTLRLKPFKNVPVNDGTHRLTLRWKPPGGIQQYETDKQTLNQAIQMLLSAVLDDDDGMLYRWESKDLKTFSTISKLTGTELRDYISPQISFIHTTSQIIFGVRLSFTDNPVKWQNGPGKKQQLKDNQVEIKVSNSSSTGGKSVIAGYILLKAPNTTSTHRYTQYIRSLMPEATPYFDIERYKKTPMGQIIPHLGPMASHVTPVCQALLHVLQGKGTAVFFRHAFSAMTDAQINNQFLFHEKWLHSVKALHLAPVIFHLDQQRIEYCDDGSIIKRSTREWAGTLTLPDKSSALCDVVNGTKERKAYLLVPAHYYEQAKEELRLYRLRLSPPSHREARFRDSVLDLPDEIHIKTAADSNVSLMDTLYTADVWQQLPTYQGKPPFSSSTKDKKQKGSTQKIKTKHVNNAWTTPPALSDQPSSDTSKEHQQVSEDDSSSLEGRLSVGTDELSTASTQSLTLASDSKYQTKLKELEVATKKKKLESLQVAGRAASKQLESLEDKFQTFATDTSKKIEEVQSELQQVVKQLAESVDTQGKISGSLSAIQVNTATQFEQIGEHLVASGENVSLLTSSMTDIREELARLFGLMAQDIAVRNASQVHQPLTHIPGGTQSTNMRPSGYHTSGLLTTESSAEGMIRSPPPKRTREGVTLPHPHSEQDNASMLFDQFEESSVLGDMTIDDDNDDEVETETHHDDVAYDFSPQADVCVDLNNRFEATETDDIHSDNDTLTQSPTPDAVTPRFTNMNTRSLAQAHSRNSSFTPPAPLDPQYTFETGPAGAADS
ncbi:hypothetical protein MHU86_9394 [Fragilaria crotonensis]|nr:hypothetical protein MHU86_9394 [Fragilaria crotonensis]